MFSLLILLAASLIVASGSIVMSGEVMTCLALRVSGLRFLARTLTTRSLSVIIPRALPCLLVTIMQPKSSLSMSSAARFAGADSSMATTGLLMTSFTSIFDLKPISAMVSTTFDLLIILLDSLYPFKMGISHLKLASKRVSWS